MVEVLLIPKQVAELFNVHPKTIYQWTIKGLLPKESIVVMPSGRLKYKESLIRKVLEDGVREDSA